MKVVTFRWTEVSSYQDSIDLTPEIIADMRDCNYDPELNSDIEAYFRKNEERWWDGNTSENSFMSVDERDLTSVEVK